MENVSFDLSLMFVNNKMKLLYFTGFPSEVSVGTFNEAAECI